MIHGDFHLRQLLAHQERVVCLDFDECGLGDPAQDIASFLVDLYFYEFTPVEARALGATFLDAYSKHSDHLLTPERLDWHVRLQFLTKAYRVYRQHQADGAARIRRLLRLAENNLGQNTLAQNRAQRAAESEVRL